ncbi:hypothetical protein [Massilia glaciei]|uniref:Uncharacterized protein n=1 Tax=Massilia glaciei TaxID=1524097 RepID=A0A2U2HNR3_9BURK|nr:hypothetical protein [Massilia glaciei]PWF49119.1 hypothetical protein C7C56_008305 [Massilia glaciei]
MLILDKHCNYWALEVWARARSLSKFSWDARKLTTARFVYAVPRGRASDLSRLQLEKAVMDVPVVLASLLLMLAVYPGAAIA